MQKRNTHYWLWFIIALFAYYEFLARATMGILQTPITTELGINDSQFTFLSTSIFLISHGFMQIPAGFITNRIGLRKTVIFATAASSIINLLICCAHSYALLLILRALMAIMASFGYICAFIIVTEYLPKDRQYFLLGLTELITGIGIAVFLIFIQHLITAYHLSWRFPFLCFFFWNSILLLFFLKLSASLSPIKKIILPPSQKAYNIRKILFITLLSSLIYFPMEFFTENHMHIFLQLQNLTANEATSSLSMLWIGYAVGGAIIGYIVDKTHKINTVFIVSCSVILFSLIAIVYGHFHYMHFSLLFFLFGTGVSCQQLTYPLVTKYGDPNKKAITVGFLNGFVSLVSATCAPLFSNWVQHTLNPSNLLETYRSSFAPIFLFPIISIVLIFSQFYFFHPLIRRFISRIKPRFNGDNESPHQTEKTQ